MKAGEGVQVDTGRTALLSVVRSVPRSWQRNAKPAQHAQPVTAQRNSTRLMKPSNSSL
ncbi:hypothetical protein BN978_02558 [Mycolicibacterium mageritense DSM 44476 = CIP 104973]|nr:hypothetical protein BN978_02558 [Mycolicibacterium mageritense DSM 44476 = CIP 104973]